MNLPPGPGAVTAARLAGMEATYIQGKARYFPRHVSDGEAYGSAWRYRPYGVIDETLWLARGYVAFDLSREVTGGQGTDRYL